MVILAAIDGRNDPDPVISVAQDLASAYEDELEVLHVMSEEDFEERWQDIEEFDLEQAIDRARQTARQVTKSTLGSTSGVTFVGRVGEPVDEILDEADEIDARYIVLGGRRRSPAGKAVFGSTTQSVLLSADVPVVTSIRRE